MRKFLALCVIMSLMFLFVVPALIADVSEIDLSSNLSFTFEPSSTIEKPLTIIPFTDVDLTQIQNESSDEVKKAKVSSTAAFGFCLWLTAFIISATS